MAAGLLTLSENAVNGDVPYQNFSNTDQVINDPVNLDATTNTDRENFQNFTSATVTFNGAITMVGVNGGAPYRGIDFDSSSTGTFVINAPVSSGTTGVQMEIVLGEGGGAAGATVVLGPNASLNDALNGGKQLETFEGNVVFDTSNLGTGAMVFVGNGYADTRSMLTGAAVTVSNPISDQGNGGDELGGSTADVSSFNGNIAIGGSTETFTAATGGRVNFNGVVFGSIAGGLVKTGAGTVVISNANTFDTADPRAGNAQGSVAADLTAGKTLITNQTGSAFGSNILATVQVESGATLGGNGISTQPVVAVGPGSIIAPGDSGADGGVASTGTLTLAGGLQITNGATLDFKINGADNDKLSFVSGDFVPTGDLTINLLNMGSQDSILSNHYYTLIDGNAGLLDASGANVNVVAPYGYAVEDVQFGTFTGLEVELIAAPEPSTYALMLGGLGFLAFCIRRKNRAAV